MYNFLMYTLVDNFSSECVHSRC